jgi:2-polyprenyl-6-hydroxyphenyl methylase/3-demethylubiquinone-9 3-methyltransferase
MNDLKGRKLFLEASGLKKRDILDVGLGECGCMSFFMAKRGFNVTGIDSSSHAIHISRKSAKRRKLRGSFQAKRANAEKMSFEDNMFDAVIAYNSLHHVENLKSVISEMFRVCKRGGWILVSDFEKNKKKCNHPIPKGFLKKVHLQPVRRGIQLRLLFL